MKIKTKLQMSIVFTLIMIIVVPLIFLAARLKTVELEEKRRIDRTMIRGVSELKSVTLDYLLHGDERSRTQWSARFESLKKLATERKSINPENMELLDKVREDLDTIRDIFSRLESGSDRFKTSGNGNAAQDMKNMLVSQLMIRTDAIINNTFRIQENVSAETLADQQRANLLVIVFLGIFALSMAANMVLLRRNIATPLLRLREGTEKIAGGDLTYRAGTGGNDEIGDLSRAFDEMAVKLQRSYETLNNEITERKRAEEALLRAHDELSKQVEERSRELREKEVLLKEVHHRVKNNLQVISSLVGLQADGSQDETVREVLRDVTDRVRSMALVHEKLYQSVDLAHINFADYARSLLNYLWRAHGDAAVSVGLTFDMEPVSLPVDTAVPCGLILNELAGNTLKHAFRGRAGGEVTVSLHNGEDGRISLCVSDNGIGLPAGFDWHRTRSLGLRLVQMLARQVDAGVEVSSEGGTKFEISLKVDRLKAEG